MSCRRLVGIDLGIASAHAVRVLDEEGTTLAKRKALPTVESLSVLESSALEGTPAGTRLEVVIEPTGPAWLPIAVFFMNRGHVVYRVSSTESADLRRYLSRHAKTNGIDADTLARIPLFHPGGVQPLELPSADTASLDRRVRAAHRLTRQVALHKTRIKALVRQVMPMSPLPGKITQADLAVLERWADPNMLVRAGRKRIAAVIVKASNNHSRHRTRRRMAGRGERCDRGLRRPPSGRVRRSRGRDRDRGPAAARCRTRTRSAHQRTRERVREGRPPRSGAQLARHLRCRRARARRQAR